MPKTITQKRAIAVPNSAPLLDLLSSRNQSLLTPAYRGTAPQSLDLPTLVHQGYWRPTAADRVRVPPAAPIRYQAHPGSYPGPHREDYPQGVAGDQQYSRDRLAYNRSPSGQAQAERDRQLSIQQLSRQAPQSEQRPGNLWDQLHQGLADETQIQMERLGQINKNLKAHTGGNKWLNFGANLLTSSGQMLIGAPQFASDVLDQSGNLATGVVHGIAALGDAAAYTATGDPGYINAEAEHERQQQNFLNQNRKFVENSLGGEENGVAYKLARALGYWQGGQSELARQTGGNVVKQVLQDAYNNPAAAIANIISLGEGGVYAAGMKGRIFAQRAAMLNEAADAALARGETEAAAAARVKANQYTNASQKLLLFVQKYHHITSGGKAGENFRKQVAAKAGQLPGANLLKKTITGVSRGIDNVEKGIADSQFGKTFDRINNAPKAVLSRKPQTSPTGVGETSTTPTDVNAAEQSSTPAAAESETLDQLQQGRDALIRAGMQPDDANQTFRDSIFGPELAAAIEHHTDGVSVPTILSGNGVSIDSEGNAITSPTHTVVAHGEPSAVAPVADAMGQIAGPDQVTTRRLAVVDKPIGPNEMKTVDVQADLPPDVPPGVADSVAKDLSSHPELIDRHGNPLFYEPIVYDNGDGGSTIHASSQNSQQQAGILPEDFGEDFVNKSDIAQEVLDRYRLPTALSIHPTITTMPASPEAAGSVLNLSAVGNSDNVQTSNIGASDNTSRSQPNSANAGVSVSPGASVSAPVDLRTPVAEAAAGIVDSRLQQAKDDPQGFSETYGNAVDPPDDTPPDPNSPSNDIPSTERASADAGALSDSGQDANDDGLNPSAKSKLDAAADAARARLKAPLKPDRLYSAGAFIPSPEHARMMADAVIVATRAIVNGVTDYAEWQKQMLKEAGDWVEPHLQFIWDEARRKLNLHANADTPSDLGDPTALATPELSAPAPSDSVLNSQGGVSHPSNRSQPVAQDPDESELPSQEAQSPSGNPEDEPEGNSTDPDDDAVLPPTHTELVAKYFGVDPEKLLASIHKRLEDRKTLADINDPDDAKLQNDIATYGAFDLAKHNGTKKINSRTWRQTLTDDINAADTKKYKTLWRLSRDKYNLALEGEQFQRSGATGNFPQKVTAPQARAMPKDSRGLPLNPDKSIHFPALEKLKQEKSVGAAEQIPPDDHTEISFRNSHLVQPGDERSVRIYPWDIYHAVKRTVKNSAGGTTGGMIGALAYDRSIAGHQYIPIHNDEINVLRDEHGIVAPDAGPQYFATKSRDGRVSAAASRPGTSTALHTLMDKGGGTLGILIGGHGMSRGGLNYGRAYRAEVKYAMETGRLRQTDLDALTRHIASKKKGLSTLKGEDISGKIHTFDDWYKLAPQFGFAARNAFYDALEDSYLAKKIGAPTNQEVLGGFNGYHDVPTGHVVALVHVEPGQGKAYSTLRLNKAHGFDPPIAESIAYNYPSRGYGHGVLKTPFPGLLLYHDALLKYAMERGLRYTGTTKNMMEWITKGGAHLTEVSPEMIRRIENWINHPYDVEKWTVEDAKRAGTDIK